MIVTALKWVAIVVAAVVTVAAIVLLASRAIDLLRTLMQGVAV